jgi:hypothetical protein
MSPDRWLLSLFTFCLFQGISWAEWVSIRSNIPAGFAGGAAAPVVSAPAGASSSNDFLTPIFPVVDVLGQMVSDGEHILISTTNSVYASSDQGASFTDTNPPFGSAGDATLNQPRLQSWFVYDQGVFRKMAVSTVGGQSVRQLFTYSFSEGVWTAREILLPGLDEAVHGELKFFKRHPVSQALFAVTARFGPAGAAVQSYLWKSDNGIDWIQITPNAAPLPGADAFYLRGNDLYLQSGGRLFRWRSPLFAEELVFDYASVAVDPKPYTIFLSVDGAADTVQERLDPMAAFVDEELGVGRHFAILDVSTGDVSKTWLPLGVDHFSQQENRLFVAGNAYTPDLSPGALLYFSETGGLTWDRLDSSGIVGEPTISFGGIVTNSSAAPIANSLVLTSTHAFLIIDGDQLWRRPLSELDFRPSTQIIRQPEHWIGQPGVEGQIRVEAVGAGALSYQWFRNDVPVPGGSLPVLSFTALNPSDSGDYRVEVTGDRGSVSSFPVRVDLAATFAAFAAENFPVGQQGPADDGDGDGVSNERAFLFGENAADPASRPTVSIQKGLELGLLGAADQSFLSLTFRKRINAVDYTIRPTAAEHLEGLSGGFSNVRQVGRAEIDGAFEVFTFRSRFSVESAPTGFMQLRVE